MTAGIIPRLRMLTQSRVVALQTAFLILLAVATAVLIAEVTFRLFADVDIGDVRLAVLATAALVAAPIAAALVRTIVKVRDEKQELVLRDNLLSAAQAYAKQGDWEFDQGSGRFILSDVLHELLGDPGRTLELTVPVLMGMVNPEDRERLTQALQRMLVGGSQEQIEYRITGLDGRERTFWVTGTRQLRADGTPIRAFGISQDITELKAVEAALRESEDHYRHAIELNPQMPWTADAQGRILDASSKWQSLTGLTREEGLASGWLKSLHPDDLGPTLQTWKETLRRGERKSDVEYRLRHKDGSYRWYRARAAARLDASGKISRWYGTLEDVHDRKMAEIALRESEAFARSILEASKDCIDVMSLDGRLLFMNGSCRKLMEAYGYSVFIGKDWIELWTDELKPKAQAAFGKARSGRAANFSFYGLTADGRMGHWDVSVSPILGTSGEPERLLCVSRDITAHKEAQIDLERAREAAQYAALHDSLTGLLNRSGFHEHLQHQLLQTSSDGQVKVLFLDLDEFKSVNDALGHPAGDQLLIQAGARLATCVRATDVVARFGGDEFAILQTKATGPEQSESLAQRVIDCLSEPYLLDGREVFVGVSIGIAMASNPEASPDDLLKKADIALYRAKKAGKGVYRFFEPGMDEAAEERQRLRSELRDAVTRGEFCVHYQPVVEFETSRVVSFEALLRWLHPRRGLLSPSEFIPLAEETGDIEEIGAWVLQEACGMATTWRDEISVSVNLSPRQFRGACLLKAVSQALSASGLPAPRLLLEITESVLLEDDAVLQRTLEELRALGVRLAIDDFGTGYSSLAYLRRFSVDNIKIDQSFVTDLTGNPRASAILRALVALGQDLGVSLTAEGVETTAQIEKLKSMGCSQGQGYLFSRPMPADAVAAFLAQGWTGSSLRRSRALQRETIH